LTTIVLASVVSERRQIEGELHSAQRQLEDHARQLEAKVTERTARLQEAVSDLEAFSYTVSHDLRAPLRSMRQFSEMLLDEHSQQLDEVAADHLKRIAAASERLDALILDVLDYNRVARSQVEFKTIDVEQLTREIILGYPHLNEHESAIAIESPMLPVYGNEIFLTQCLSNLLGNAVKFARPNEPLKIRVRTEPRGDRVALWVEDNGIGIEPQYHSRIFGLFERLHSEHEYPGTGMGLAIVRRATERMGGKIGFESKPGVGTRFWMELRAAKTSAAN
jgi:signal transduction histidine kinase